MSDDMGRYDPHTDTISRAKAIEALKNDMASLDHIIKGMSAYDVRLDAYVSQRNQVNYDIYIINNLPPAQPERTPMQELLDVTADRDYWKAQCHSYEMTINRLTESAQPERIKGHWTRDNACSECGCQPWFSGDIHNYNFCPNCGADMRGEQDDSV